MKIILIKFLLLLTVTFNAQPILSQFPIKLPKVPKIEKPKEVATKTDGDVSTRTDSPTVSKPPTTSDSKLIYNYQKRPSVPVFLKNKVYVQAVTHNEYWKMPGQDNFSSWVPSIRFSLFYNAEKPLSYAIEYFNPDGTAWFAENLECNSLSGDRTYSCVSPSPYGGVLDKKSTNGIGMYSFKITNSETKEILYRGKFKIGKFWASSRPQEKNKFDFFVEHDWILPFATVGLPWSEDLAIGGMKPTVEAWFKGDINLDELDGRLFYKGSQIASSKDKLSSPTGCGERYSKLAPAFSPQNVWKCVEFQWDKLRFDNNGSFNRDYFPEAHYADKNPGEYTVKIYRNNTQIRELNFSIGADGKFVEPAYTSQIFTPFHRIVIPAKITDASEKRDANAWKTDAFYANPISSFSIQ